jgi:hypothetical protein
MRCYFRYLGHIVAAEPLSNIIDDEDAIKRAETLLLNRQEKFSEFEVWDGDRLVYRFAIEDPEMITE